MNIGTLELGTLPRVVGTVCTIDSLDHIDPHPQRLCDLLEIRYDLMQAHADRCHAAIDSLEGSGVPVVFTVRAKEEGGQWQGNETQREALYRNALEHCSLADVELNSKLVPVLTGIPGAAVILSYHDFERTPSLDTLVELAEKAFSHGDIVFKVAVQLSDPDATGRLEALLQQTAGKPVCVLGMGEGAKPGRVLLPGLGSCLTYGYLDSEVASGQWYAPDLVAALAGAIPAYAEDRETRLTGA